MFRKLSLVAAIAVLLSLPAFAQTKLSQINNGGTVNIATDQIVGVRSGTTDELLTLGALAGLANAPAVSLTGNTLNSAITTSSLTTVGTIGTGVWQGTPLANTYITQLVGNTLTNTDWCTSNGTIINCNTAPPPTTSAAVIALFTGCSGTQYLGADGACHNAGGGSGTVTSVTFTGDGVVLSSTPSSAVMTNGTLIAALANQTANTVLGALTATTPSDLAVPSCSAAGNALKWTSGIGFGCSTGFGTGSVTSVATNNGLAGGTITTTGTIGLASVSNNNVLCNNSGSSAVPIATNCTITGTGNMVMASAPVISLASGSLASTQAESDTSTYIATDGFVAGITNLASLTNAIALAVVGTINTGVWNGTPITDTYILNSSMTIGGQLTRLGSSTQNQGNGAKIQLSSGGTTTNHCMQYDANGNAVDSGSACSGGSGTLTSVTFTGDGVVLSSTPSAAVTTTGTLTAALASAGANTVLGNFSGSTAVPTYGTADSVNALLGITSITPQGRLTLSSIAPVMNADATAQTTVYYLPYTGNIIPVYDGTQFTNLPLGSSGISLTLNTTNMPGSEVFDVYEVNVSRTPTLCAMYWGGNTSRSTTAGGNSGTADASIVQINGLWVNHGAIATSNCYNNTTSYTISANKGTYLGTIYTTANGQTGMTFKPSAASGGSNNILGVYNAYNRILVNSLERDSTASWTYGTATWRAANNSNSNRISFVDGLQQSHINAIYQCGITSGTPGVVFAATGSVLDSTSAAVIMQAFTGEALGGSLFSSTENFYPQLGFHYIQAMEFSTGETSTFTGGGTNQALQINLEM